MSIREAINVRRFKRKSLIYALLPLKYKTSFRFVVVSVENLKLRMQRNEYVLIELVDCNRHLSPKADTA